MDNKKIGQIIAELRKEKNMTQMQLADLVDVTDKAVSKWERGLSYPGVSTLKKLAEVLEIPLDELMMVNTENNRINKNLNLQKRIKPIFEVINKAVALAMGVAVIVLSILNELNADAAFIMLGLAVFLLALDRLMEMNR